MFSDQLAHPLAGRDATGSGVDLSAARHDARHDTTPAGPGSRRQTELQRVFGPDRARIRVHMVPVGSRGRPNRSFHLVDQLLGRLQVLYQVRDRRFRCRLNRFRFRKRLQTNETSSDFRTQDHAFSFFELRIRIWTSRNHQTGCARLGNTPLRRAPLAESGRRPRAYGLPFVMAFQANTGPSTGPLAAAPRTRPPGAAVDVAELAPRYSARDEGKFR